jgi:hypothetical protein
MSAIRHLLTVWNPAYAVDALASHAELLAAQHRAGETDALVWWGLVRSPHRLQELPHLDEILALDTELQGRLDAGHELQLYLTDYRSLYVGDVVEISGTAPDDETQVPAYYRSEGLTCDAWFALDDIRAIVTDDMASVQQELAQLRNTRYHNKRVSIFGGMAELPLLVTRPDGARFFLPGEREQLNDGRAWVLADSERTGLGAMMQQLRDDLLGEAAWRALSPACRTFVATSERILRTHRSDPAFDFSPALVELAKAVEVECKRLLPLLFADAPPAVVLCNIDGRSEDLRNATELTIGNIVHLLTNDGERITWLRQEHGPAVQWLVSTAAAVLDELARYRNPAAHEAHVRLADALAIRNRWLGVGCRGHLVDLAELGRYCARGA